MNNCLLKCYPDISVKCQYYAGVRLGNSIDFSVFYFCDFSFIIKTFFKYVIDVVVVKFYDIFLLLLCKITSLNVKNQML